ncbi:Uncharacterized [Syntrophomonas zehnderi OL-4]|uniref:Uncharacterized n=1 Tax=Syntrophomonas zehnderi OL-4 TaxID=690567 RepID=A0A0E4C7E1_9FIRM|nr:hypothetical protein [Syntrophomonas zehnderi]CFW97871.1 Uncharacterized [Syntrophomonas zehnderi OL-4]
MMKFTKRISRMPIFILVIAVLVTGIAYYGVSTQAQDPPKLNLGKMTLQVDRVEYYPAPAYNDLPDIVMINAQLYNNAGKDIKIDPTGELILIGAGGKEYLMPSNKPGEILAPFDLQRLQYLHQDTQKLIDMGLATTDELLPVGLLRWGFGTQIDREDRITAILYRNGNDVKKLDISQVKTVVHERKTELGEEDFVVQRDRELYGP